MSRKLAPAIRRYKSLDFRPVPPDRIVASPHARSSVSLERYLDQAT
ncbi:MAG TPA: hypothetical protein VEV17_17730 [Bryobacteraceae bacterium]|nr:hypothetical protein [Bryobacteraceae bacterium]